MLSPKDEKSIIALVSKHNPNFENKHHQIKPRQTIGDSRIYSVIFEGPGAKSFENFVLKRGSDLFHYHNPEDLLQRLSEIVPAESDPEQLNRRVVAAVVMVLTVSLVAGMFMAIDAKALAMLAGIWGTAFGYFLPKTSARAKSA